MQNPATAASVRAAEYQVPEGTTDVRLQTWLDVAWRGLQGEDATLVGRVTAGTLDVAAVTDVIISAALRVLRNPDGVEQESGGVDDYTESFKRRDATEDVYFTTAELRRLGIGAAANTPPPFTGSLRYDR